MMQPPTPQTTESPHLIRSTIYSELSPDSSTPPNNNSPMPPTDLIYQLEDKPPLLKTLLSAFVHLMAMFVAVITPSLLICKGLGLNDTDTSRIISMSLFASGISSFINIHGIGMIGARLLSIQGTSFNFVSPIILGGMTLKNGGMSDEAMLGAVFGTLMLCSIVEMIISQIIPLVRKIISPLISGIVVLIIGLSLIDVGLVSIGGGFGAKADGSFGALKHLFLAGSVIGVIVILNLFKNQYLRISSLFIAMVVGVLLAYGFEGFGFSMGGDFSVVVPHPFYFGLGIDMGLILPLVLVYMVTSLESIADITATCEVSNQPIKGEMFLKRLRGGVLANGINSCISAILGTFPNSCFSQNNGVIALTGVASRYVGYFVALMLVVLGLFPIVANLTLQIPEPILGGVTLVMFGTIAATGVRIIAKDKLSRRSILIIAISLGIGLGVSGNPDVLQFLPTWMKTLFVSGIASGGICAILLDLILPREKNMGE